MSLLYALAGSFDMSGGNVLFPGPPAAPITGEELPAARKMALPVGLAERPLGPADFEHIGVGASLHLHAARAFAAGVQQLFGVPLAQECLRKRSGEGAFADALGALTQITDAAFTEYRAEPHVIADMRHRFAQWRQELLTAGAS